MSFMDKISKFVGQNETEYNDNIEEEYEEDYYVEEEEEYEEEQPAAPKKSAFGAFRSSASRSDNVVDINRPSASGRPCKVVLVKPAVFNDAKSIADKINQKCLVILNLETTSREVAHRLVDFLTGVVYANNGKISKVAVSTYVIAPNGYELSGDMMESIQNGEIVF